MAIKLKMGELYGMNSINEVMKTIKSMKLIGMSDDDIQKVLERSKVRTGHWINDSDIIGCFYCSECGGYTNSYDDAYCKYCGAKMRGC